MRPSYLLAFLAVVLQAAPAATNQVIIATSDIVSADLFGSSVKLVLSPEKSAELSKVGASHLALQIPELTDSADTAKRIFVSGKTVSTHESSITIEFPGPFEAKQFRDALKVPQIPKRSKQANRFAPPLLPTS